MTSRARRVRGTTDPLLVMMLTVIAALVLATTALVLMI